MALAKGINSYMTTSEADAFFADRLDVAAWDSASENQKSQALVTATLLLDSLSWIGIAVSETQELAFPRVGSYIDPKIGYEIQLNSQAIPKRIEEATCELAYHLLNNDGLLDETGEVESISLGAISLTKVRSASKIPFQVKQKIKPLLSNNGVTRAWWRAN